MNLSAILPDHYKQLIDLIQTEFPITSEPYTDIAKILNQDTETVIASITELKNKGIIRRIGPIFDPVKLGYTSALFAVMTQPDKERSTAEHISTYQGVTHNYHRDHTFNLWFTLVAYNEESMDSIISQIQSATNPIKLIKLKAIKTYKINAVFDSTAPKPDKRIGSPYTPLSLSRACDERLTSILKVIQTDLPLTTQPFRVLATTHNLNEDEILNTISENIHNGIIRRYGGIIGHRHMGYNYNIMLVLNIPSLHIDAVGSVFAEKDYISHCYHRVSCNEWQYNLYAMIHAKTETEAKKYITELKEITSNVTGEPADCLTLKSGKEYKKSSLRILDR